MKNITGMNIRDQVTYRWPHREFTQRAEIVEIYILKDGHVRSIKLDTGETLPFDYIVNYGTATDRKQAMNKGNVIVFQSNKIVGPRLGVVEEVAVTYNDVPHTVVLQTGEKVEYSAVIGTVQLVQNV